jgi:glycosyltransferase involved in cell wall biosynthesis
MQATRTAAPAAIVPGLRELDDRDFQLLYENNAEPCAHYRLSIVTPNFNRGRILMNMLASLCRQACDFQGIEMLIVDDGGAAEEVKIIAAMALPFRLRYYWQPDQGWRLGRVRNYGIRQAQGAIVLFLDSDILASPRLIQDHLTKHQGRTHQVVIGDLKDLARDETPVFWRWFGLDARFKNPFVFAWQWLKREWLLPWNYRGLGKNPGLAFCAMHGSVQREDLLAVNGFDPDFDGSWSDEDLDLGCRLRRAGARFRWSGKSFVYHQWHPVSNPTAMTNNRLKLFLKNPEVLAARKISQLQNPFRHFSLEDIRRCQAEEAEEAASPRQDPPASRLIYDNGLVSAEAPRISLVVSTADRAHFLAGFLDSVERQTLDKSWFEVIVADNGSRDGSAGIIRDQPRPFRLIHIWQEARGFGMGSNRNHGVAAARADLIVMADVDVLLPENFLEAHYQRHQEQSGRVLIGVCYYTKPGEALRPDALTQNPVYPLHIRFKLWLDETRQAYLSHLSRQGRYAFSSLGSTVHCSFHRGDFDAIGGFDEAFDAVWGLEDTDFFYRLEQSGLTIEFFFKALVYHRWHPWARTRLWVEENWLLFMAKHPELLKQRLIGIRLNPHYLRPHVAVRCEYVWARRLRRLGKAWRGYTAFQNLAGRLVSAWKILLPALLYRWRGGLREARHP